jgi:hypothetical protein
LVYRHNTEKVIYFLLLDRKMRQPSHEDVEDAKQRSRSGSRKFIFQIFLIHSSFISADVPQKRVDRHRSNGTSIGQSPNPNSCRPSIVGQLAEGSPLVPRRQLYSNNIRYQSLEISSKSSTFSILFSNKTISANNTPSVSPCSSPTITKKDVFAKITAFNTNKSSVETPTSQPIHRHHRNTSTVSQNENILTTQPSTQSIAISSDKSYSSVNTETTINNGTTTAPTYHPTRRHIPPPIIPPPSPQTSESMNMDLSPSVVSNNNNNSLTYTSPNPTNLPQTPNNNQWRHKLNNLKQSFQGVGTPRFHRRPKVLCKCSSFFKSIHLNLFFSN